MRPNLLKNWLKNTNQFILDKDSDIIKKYTHLLLDGGKVSIQPENLETFYKLYAECLTKKISLHVVEQKTPIFKLFFDLDFLNEDIMEFEFITNVINLIQEVMLNVYSYNHKVILCTTSPKQVNKNDKCYFKQGIHLHYPTIFVDSDTAIKIRTVILHKLQTTLGERNEINTWNDVVDYTVFKSNGIRMIGSSKCSFKKGEDGKTKLIDEKKIYMPVKIIDCYKKDYEEELQELLKDNIKLVKNTSIQSFEIEITKTLNLPEIKEDECDECDEDDENLHSQKSRILSKSSIEHKAIFRFFEVHVPNYSVNDLKNIMCFGKNAYVIKTKSKFCQNVERSHKSCQIYFKLTKKGLTQRCLCVCDTLDGRKFGYCKDYESTHIKCTDKLLQILEWNSKKKSIDTTNSIIYTSNIDTFRNKLLTRFSKN
jgi:hypothetical protein